MEAAARSLEAWSPAHNGLSSPQRIVLTPRTPPPPLRPLAPPPTCLQMSLQQGCNAILRHDCIALSDKLYKWVLGRGGGGEVLGGVGECGGLLRSGMFGVVSGWGVVCMLLLYAVAGECVACWAGQCPGGSWDGVSLTGWAPPTAVTPSPPLLAAAPPPAAAGVYGLGFMAAAAAGVQAGAPGPVPAARPASGGALGAL